MEAQIEKLTQLGVDAVQSAINDYTHYFILWSISWLVFGAMCATLAILIWRKRDKWDDYDGGVTIGYLAVVLLSLIAALTIPFNVPMLIQPRAYAIHQLLQDAQ